MQVINLQTECAIDHILRYNHLTKIKTHILLNELTSLKLQVSLITYIFNTIKAMSYDNPK